MAILTNTLNAGTSGTNVTKASTLASGAQATYVMVNNTVTNSGGSAIQYSNDLASVGIAITARIDSTIGKSFLRWDSTDTGTRYVARRALYLTALPNATMNIISLRFASTFAGAINLEATTGRAILYAKATAINATRSSWVPSLNTLYWCEVAITPESIEAANDGIIEYRITDSAGTVVSEYTLTNADVGAGTITEYRFGVDTAVSSITYDYLGEVQLGPLESGWFGPIGGTVQLDTPVLTVTATTAASPQTSDGTVTVSWPAVANASGYRALTAPAGTTTYAVQAESVTSPYTFTGLPAGDIRLGIQAKHG